MSSHIVRWCAAQQNWDKIHYDQRYAHDVSGLPGPVINGALKQHLIVQFLNDSLKSGWVWRLDYRFTGMDFIGQTLEVRGTISAVEKRIGYTLSHVDITIHNRELDETTTSGKAIVIFSDDHDLRFQGPSNLSLPDDFKVDENPSAEDPKAPVEVRAKLGKRLEYLRSDYAIDLSRLRLFADAIGGVHRIHYDPTCPGAKEGKVLAPPLYPLHGIELMPGQRPLSTDPMSIGREGVNEIGRDMRRHFGIEISWNGGNKVEIHSLAAVGERIAAESTLVAAAHRVGRRGGPMLCFETLNRYNVVNGRALLSERQTMICRLPEGRGGE